MFDPWLPKLLDRNTSSQRDYQIYRYILACIYTTTEKIKNQVSYMGHYMKKSNFLLLGVGCLGSSITRLGPSNSRFSCILSTILIYMFNKEQII